MSVAPRWLRGAVAVLATFASVGRAQVTGVVYADRNANGQRDAGEAGVARVTVSNQVDVVTTDSAGHFTFGSVGTGVVFVSVPDGFRATSRFWQPASGSAISFGVTQSANADVVTFIHASDTHIQASSVPRMDRLRAIIDSVAPAFVIITGDLVRDALRVNEIEARGYYELYLRHVVSNLSDVVAAIGQHPFPVALGGHFHARERLEWAEEGRQPTRFEQTGAVVGPGGGGPFGMASGITVFSIRNGRISEGTFVRLDPPPPQR